MVMSRLTEEAQYPLDRFDRCQFCGRVDADLCTLRMWYECDEQDQPENPPRVLVICRGEEDYDEGRKCRARLDHHPRGYRPVPWLGGSPGHFLKLCGPCTFRSDASCTHPDLKINGGQGLDFGCHKHPLAGSRVCLYGGENEVEHKPFDDLQFWECAGLKVKP